MTKVSKNRAKDQGGTKEMWRVRMGEFFNMDDERYKLEQFKNGSCILRQKGSNQCFQLDESYLHSKGIQPIYNPKYLRKKVNQRPKKGQLELPNSHQAHLFPMDEVAKITSRI